MHKYPTRASSKSPAFALDNLGLLFRRSLSLVPTEQVRKSQLAMTPPYMSAARGIQRNTRGYRGRGGARGRFASRGRGRGSNWTPRGRGRDRGGYQGASSVPFTPVEPGYRFFKQSMLDDPWLELVTPRLPPNYNPEEIQLAGLDELDDGPSGDEMALDSSRSNRAGPSSSALDAPMSVTPAKVEEDFA